MKSLTHITKDEAYILSGALVAREEEIYQAYCQMRREGGYGDMLEAQKEKMDTIKGLRKKIAQLL